MHAASLPRFRHGLLKGASLVLLYALIISVGLLAFVALVIGGAHQTQPDPELLAPFRWLRPDHLA